MRPEHRISQALKVIDTSAMCQFDKDSNFAQALRDLLAEQERLRETIVGLWHGSMGGGTLSEALGMTEEDYGHWAVKGPNHAED